ncbi:hypothetical protein UFOVP903_57 [uncultured Caudovirales phage]|uniref:Uncharacterized protein n=1 Tax=uncultured Caudovirales phage TaxID=2100421 RepID=A0A6J5RWK6_9CAUD|nr:hypothetical protein UFOVP903_57 [uncultured Caudovirales phage]CAB4197981.1 hypothetical protein UFOVP1318_47 [uncultured Caudovirales phage]CAB4210907.1 hypothetical protein UFOVP1430_55 [uncultured Caudovirales phage]
MPLKSQLHVNKLLSNVSVQYKNEEYIWDKVFPILPVTKDTDLYRVYDRNFKIPETSRAPKAVAKEFTFEFSTSSYALEQHALKDYVGVDEEEQNDMGSLQVDTTESLTDAIYRRIELSVAALFTKTSWSLSVSLAAGSAFSDNTVTSDPVRIFDTAASTIIAQSAKTPTFGILPRAGFLSVKNHVSVLDRVKYTSSEVSKNMIQALIGLSELHVPVSVYDTAAEGVAASLAPFFTNAFVGWKPAGGGGLKTPSCGYTFMGRTPRVRSWKDEERNATAIEVEVKYSPKVVASLTGYLIGGI